MTSNCVSVLIDAVEHLFYSLQAKLILELANCELCASFKLDVRQRAFEDKFTLPPAWQMHKILVGFKEALDCPSVARHVNHELIKDHQESINFNAMKTLIDVGGTIANDVLGYRRFVLEIVSDEESSFNKKWDGLAHVYDPPPKDVVMIHSERYVAIFPMVTVPYDRPFSELPFDEGEPEDIDEYERQIIVAHRNATLAKLEGSSVGKVRREENRRSIPDYVREKKCVCLSSCSCSHECTYDVERECPCAERMMRIVLSDCRTEPGNHTFGFRCTSLGRVIFEGLCAMRHDCTPEDINAEMDRALEVFDHEIQVEREAFPSIEEMAF